MTIATTVVRPRALKLWTLLPVLGCVELLSLGCTSATQPKSAPLVSSDVKVHQSEARPKLVKLERSGDPLPALAAAFLHGLDAGSSQGWAKQLQARLVATGLQASVRSFATGTVISFPLGPSGSGVNPIEVLRDAMQTGALTATRNTLAPDVCGMTVDTSAGATSAAGFSNVVLGVVGEAQALDRVTTWYNAAGEWAPGKQPEFRWPTVDAVRSEPGTGPAEVVVARRTPERARSMQAAYAVGEGDSTFSLLAHSFPGRWRILESQSNYEPGGACVAVRLQSQTPTSPMQAARAARALASELEWILTEETDDQDPRLVALEAKTSQEAAERAAWLSAVELVPVGKETTSFAQYRGPRGDTKEFATQWAERAPTDPLALESNNEPGQGHVWASLVSPCAVQHEDESTAGHAWSALMAAVKTSPSQRQVLQASTTLGQVGLVAAQSSRLAGAEDRTAETLARSLLLFHRDSSAISELRTEIAAGLPSAPTWSLALKLATGGHPSWLTALPIEQSLTGLSPETARQAVESFVGSPLALRVLSTQGPAQAQRLAARLTHLLSGLRQRSFSCLAPSARRELVPPSGEYGVGAPVGTPAVLLYVLDGRFASAVRRVANALQRSGGWLERSVPAGVFQVHVSAAGLGSTTTLSALAFTITADSDEHLSGSVSQLRELVQRLTLANLGLANPTDLDPPVLPEQRLNPAISTSSEENALLNELLTRALPTAATVYVKPVQSN